MNRRKFLAAAGAAGTLGAVQALSFSERVEAPEESMIEELEL